MTIDTNPPEVTYMGNGSTTAFDFSFQISETDQIEVFLTDSSGNVTVIDPNLYTVVPDDIPSDNIWIPGGTVNYPLTGSPVPAGTQITIQRTVPYEQPFAFSNQGTLYQQAIEQAIDFQSMQTQQVQEQLSFALQVPTTDSTTPNVLPPAAERVGGVLGFDNTGQPVIVGGVSASSQGVLPYGPKAASAFTLGPNGGSGTTSISDVTNVGTVINAGATTNSDIIRGYGIAVPATPYTLTAAVKGPLLPANSAVGIYLSDGTKLVTFDYNYNTTTPVYEIAKWTNSTTLSATYTTFAPGNTPYMYRIPDNGTNLLFSISVDGTNFSQVFSVSRTNWMSGGPTTIGFFYNGHSSLTSTTGFATLTYWSGV